MKEVENKFSKLHHLTIIHRDSRIFEIMKETEELCLENLKNRRENRLILKDAQWFFSEENLQFFL